VGAAGYCVGPTDASGPEPATSLSGGSHMTTAIGGTVADDVVPVGAAEVATPDDSGGHRPPSGRWLTVVGIASLVLPVVAYLVFIHHFAVNAIWSDQWADISLIRHAHDGTLSLSTLWAQHTSNRIFFPNLIVLVLASLTRFDVVTEEYLSAAFLTASAALLILTHRRRAPATPWLYYCPVVLLLFTFVGGNPYYGGTNTLWGFTMGLYLVLLCLAGTLYLLDRQELTTWAYVGALAAAVVGSYSATQGLLIWPAGLLLIWLRRRPPSRLAVWVVAAVATTALFLVHYDAKAGMSQPGYLLSHPVESVKFLLFSIGDNLFGQVVTSPPGPLDVVVGALVLVLAGWVVVRFGIRRDEATPAPVGAVLVVYGLLFTGMVTASRAWQGFFQTGRYETFEVLVWVGCYLAVVGRRTQREEAATDRGVALAKIGLLVLIALQVLAGTPNGWRYAQADRTHQLQAADVTVHMGSADDALVYASDGGWDPAWVRPLAAFARAQHLSLFDTPLAAQLVVRGLDPSLQSKLVRPSYGATVSGRVLLVGVSNLTHGTSAFEFLVSGGPTTHRLRPAQEVHATPSAYGYLGPWDSAAVADGYYDVRTEVVHTDGTRAVGDPVPVRVLNHPIGHRPAARAAG